MICGNALIQKYVLAMYDNANPCDYYENDFYTDFLCLAYAYD